MFSPSIQQQHNHLNPQYLVVVFIDSSSGIPFIKLANYCNNN